MNKKKWLHRIAKCGVFLGIFFASAQSEPLTEKNIETPSTNRVFSLRLKQAPLVPTLQQLASEQHTSLIIDDELDGTISLQLQRADLDQVLRSVAKIKNLNLWQENNIYYLNKADKNTQFATNMGEPENFGNSTALFNTTPAMRTATIKLHYAKASEVIKSLTATNGALVSDAGRLTFDDRSNVLIVQDDSESIANIRKLVAELDKPIEQIAIEARIVTMSADSLKELGVRWGMFDATSSAHKVSGSLAANGFSNLSDNLNVNFTSSATPAGTVALQIAKINGRLLDLELSALEQENNVEIIASPRLLTTNKKSASIKQGTEIPYIITNTKSETQSVEFRDAVLGLEVTPHISQNNAILMDLVVSQNSPSNRVYYNENSEMVSIDKQEIQTQVFAKDGETIVLGGVFHDTITKTENKVPLLGDIPAIGKLFSNESERHQKRELVIFVTPRILKNGETLEQLQKKEGLQGSMLQSPTKTKGKSAVKNRAKET